MGLDAMIFIFWMLRFKTTFSVSSFTFVERFFSSPSLSAIRVASSAYLRLLIFLPEIFSPACDSPSLAFHMMYSAYELSKQGNNMQPSSTHFPILNQSIVPCLVLTVASWPAYRCLKRQVRVVWYFNLFKNVPQFVMIHTIKGFSIANEAEVDIFLKFTCFFFSIMQRMLAVWSLDLLPFLNPACSNEVLSACTVKA